jgi:hypothetical protein
MLFCISDSIGSLMDFQRIKNTSKKVFLFFCTLRFGFELILKRLAFRMKI